MDNVLSSWRRAGDRHPRLARDVRLERQLLPGLTFSSFDSEEAESLDSSLVGRVMRQWLGPLIGRGEGKMRGLVDSRMDEREEGWESVERVVDMLTDEGRVCEVGAGVADVVSSTSQPTGRCQ